MKRILALLLAACLLVSLVPFTVAAAEEKTDGYFTYTVENEEATLVRVNSAISGDVVIPSQIDSTPITKIGELAFENCTGITNVTIPENVMDIGKNAFKGCSGLEKAYFEFAKNWAAVYVEYFEDEDQFGFIPTPLSIEDISNPETAATYLTNTYVDNFWVTLPDLEFEIENGEATLVYVNGAISGDVVIPDAFKGYPVTAIGQNAFKSCYDMTGITIPANVVTIENPGLSSCEDLVSITVDEDNPVYHSAGNCIIETDTNTLIVGCKGSVIPSDGSVTEIGPFAFDCCEKLASITIPESVTTIGQLAFQHCHALTSVTIPESVTEIGWGAFYGCHGLTDVYFETTEGWFADDVSLSAEDLADSEKAAELLTDTYSEFRWEIVDELFTYEAYEDGAYLLSAHPSVSGDVVVPDTYEGNTVVGIYHGAFYDCANITSVTIPETVEWIGEDIFSYCTALESITVDENNPCYVSVGNCLIDTESNTLVAGCKNSVIPTDLDLEYIAAGAFAGSEIDEITIPESVTYIGWGAFYDCESLTNVYFENTEKWYADAIAISSEDLADPEKAAELLSDTYREYDWTVVDSLFTYDVYEEEAFLTDVHASVSGDVVIPDTYEGLPVTGVDYYAFAYCENVTSVTIPESVIYIGHGAFEGCEALTDVYFENTENWYAEATSLSSEDLEDSEKAAELLTLELFECVWERVTSLFTYEVYDEDAYLVRVHPAVSGDVVIPETYEGVPVQGISPDAFYGCANITGVTIPKGVLYISLNPFANCPSLESIVVDKDNPVYHSAGNCIIETDTNTLVVGCKGSVIPSDGSVTAIEYYAFRGSEIGEITIPESVTYIGYRAFYRCENLTDVYFENTENWYAEATALSSEDLEDSEKAAELLMLELFECEWERVTSFFTFNVYEDGAYLVRVHPAVSGDVVIPETYEGVPVQGISPDAFGGCANITGVTIPKGVLYISLNPFASCSSLESIIVDKDNPRYHSDGNCLIETESKTLIAGCNTSVIPSDGSVTAIEYYAFSGSEIGEITIPESVTYIGYCAFEGCENLTDVYFENTEDWFTEDGVISSSVLKDSEAAAKMLADISCDYVWENYSNVEDFTYEIYGDGAYLISVNRLCSGAVVIPDTYEGYPVTGIEYGAFEGCTGVTSVTIPESVYYIGENVFASCSSLESIIVDKDNPNYHSTGNCLINTEEKMLVAGCKTSVIPSDGSVVYISSGAFYRSDITEITIPESVTYIGYCAFEGCDSLTDVYFESAENWYADVETIPADALEDSENAALILSQLYADYNLEKVDSVFKFSVYEDEVSLYSVHFSASGDIVIPDTYEGLPVTAIDYYAFANCRDVTSVTIPESVEYIGYSAFENCGSLTDIHFENTEKWYTAGGDPVDPEILKDSESAAKYFIEEAPCLIKRDDFEYDIYKDGAYLISVLKTVSGDVVIPETYKGYPVLGIAEYAFENCANITSVSIPKTVTEIEPCLFYGCNSLESITVDKDNPVYHSAGNCIIDTELGVIVAGCKESVIPDDGSVSAIGYAAFLGCGFESITIPESVVEIGYGAFGECENLKSIRIPAGVSYIDEAIIVGCSNLETVSVDENNPYYHSEENCIIETDSKTLIAGCKESVIPTYVEIIGKYAFAECYALESIDIPESVTIIDEFAFAWCNSLKSMTIPENVEYIGADAFLRCVALESIVFENKTGWFCNGYPVDEEIFDDTETLAEAIKYLDEPLTKSVRGDIDGEYGVSANDAIYLLYNVFFGDENYPVSQDCDFDSNGTVNANDAIYLLYHIFFGDENYPLY